MSTFSTETHCCLFVAGIFKGFNWLKGNEVMTCIYGFFYQGNKANPSLDSITNKTVLRNTLLVAKTQKQKSVSRNSIGAPDLSVSGVNSSFLNHTENRVNLDMKTPHQNVGDASKMFSGNETTPYQQKRKTQHARTRARG